MYDVHWTLHLLAALDAALALFTRGGAYVVIKRYDVACTARFANDLDALGIVVAHHLCLVEKIDIRIRQRMGKHFEAIFR